jgi:hypothetical protein
VKGQIISPPPGGLTGVGIESSMSFPPGEGRCGWGYARGGFTPTLPSPVEGEGTQGRLRLPRTSPCQPLAGKGSG